MSGAALWDRMVTTFDAATNPTGIVVMKRVIPRCSDRAQRIRGRLRDWCLLAECIRALRHQQQHSRCLVVEFYVVLASNLQLDHLSYSSCAQFPTLLAAATPSATLSACLC